jgi:hypothetical protein
MCFLVEFDAEERRVDEKNKSKPLRPENSWWRCRQYRKSLSSEEYLPDLNVNLMKTFIGTELSDSILAMTCILRMAHQNGTELVLRQRELLRSENKSRKEGHRNNM